MRAPKLRANVSHRIWLWQTPAVVCVVSVGFPEAPRSTGADWPAAPHAARRPCFAVGRLAPPPRPRPTTRSNSTTPRRPEASTRSAVRPRDRPRAAGPPGSPRCRSSQDGGRRPIPAPHPDRSPPAAAARTRTGAIGQREECLAGKAGAAEENAHLRERQPRPIQGDPRGVADDRKPAVSVASRAMRRQAARTGRRASRSRQKARSCARSCGAIPLGCFGVACPSGVPVPLAITGCAEWPERAVPQRERQRILAADNRRMTAYIAFG